MKFKLSMLALCAGTISSVYAQNPADQKQSVVTSPVSITIIGKAALENAEIAGTPVKELPINVHVVNDEEIQRLKFVDPDELLDRIPGETQVRNLRIPSGGKGYTIPMVDGIALEDPYEGATQRIDRVNTGDIQRVEVIKGPASAVYPSNSFGGVINVVTRDAPETTETKVWFEAGNFSRHRIGVNSGGKANRIGYFLDANSRRLEGLREGAKNDRDQFSGKFLYDANDNARLIVRLEHLREDVVARGDLTAEQIAEDPTQAGGLSSATDLEQDAVSMKLEQELPSGYVDASLVWREKDTVGLSRFRGPQDENDRGLSSKLLYRHELDGASIISGFETYDGAQDVRQYQRKDVQLQGEFKRFENSRDIRAAFLQYESNITYALSFSAGLRYEDVSLESGQFAGARASFDDMSPKLGLTYKLSDKNMVWFGASQGFYAPDAGDLFDADTGNSELQPELATNLELGIRGRKGAWNYDSSYYHNQIKNYLVTQEFLLDGLEFERTTNAGQVTVQGLESVLEYAPAKANWRIGFTHTYARNIYDSFVSSDGDFSGNELSRSPRHHLNTRLAWLPFTHWTFELEGDFYSRYYSDSANTEKGRFKRGERLNFRVSYDRGPLSFWLHGINLTDTLEDRATYSRGQLKFRTVDGRSWYAGVAYKF